MQQITFTGASDTACGNGYVFVLSPDTLTVLKDGNITGIYKGIGSARQVRVGENGIVCVTARESGLWCFSVKGGIPTLLSHFRTVEYATGLFLCGNIAFVSCRQYGVEKIDLSDPRRPKHLGTIRMGEAQSCTVARGFLYGGIWGEMKVVCADPNTGKKLYEIPLSGRGDGVCVKGNRLYAVTGQHRRGMKGDTPSDPCFGRGNGLECYDLSVTPPALLWRTEFGYDYTRSCDTWRPIPIGDAIVCAMSSLGVFVTDAETGMIRERIPAKENDPVTGIAADGTDLYISSKGSGVCSLPFPGETGTDECGKIDPVSFVTQQSTNGLKIRTVFSEEGRQVLDAIPYDGGFALACCDSLLLIDRNGKKTGSLPLPGGECLALASENGVLCAALDSAGLAVFGKDGALKSRYDCGKPVQQVCLSESGRYAMISCGAVELRLLDLTNDGDPVCLSVLNERVGQLYGANFAKHRRKDGTMFGFWHRDGLFYTNPDHGIREIRLVPFPMRVGFLGFGPENGIDTDGEQIRYNYAGGLITLPIEGGMQVESAPVTKGPVSVDGKFTLFGPILAASRRDSGRIALFRIEEDRTVPLGQAQLPGNPGPAFEADGKFFLPCGYEGLLSFGPADPES